MNHHPYRQPKNIDVAPQTESGNIFCRTFGCGTDEHNIPIGIYVLSTDIDNPIFSYQECNVCGREFAKLYANTDYLQLYRSNLSPTGWVFLYTPYTFRQRENINLIDYEFDAEVRVVASMSEVPNINFVKYKYSLLCSNVGCRPNKVYTNKNGEPNYLCKRCNQVVADGT